MRNTEPTTQRLPSASSEPSGQDRPFSLVIIAGERTSTYPLPAQGHVLIGRSAQADIRINHPSVSREHAALAVGSSLRLEDLGSSNGTRVHGRQIARDESVSVNPGDVIDLGEVLLVIQYRRLEQGLNRVVPAEYLDLRRDELARKPSEAAFVVRLRLEGSPSSAAVEAVLASALRDSAILAARESNVFDVLFLGGSELDVAERTRIVLGALAARGLVASAQRLPLTSAPPSLSPHTERPQDLEEHAGTLRSRDPIMQTVLALLLRVARTDLSVILLGETGVGKELCAEYLWQASPRKGRKLLRLNCAALSESLLESELFGHERGAFTGAVRERVGLLESAHGGTVFLDEVGDMPLSIQAKLLRVLEAKEVLRVGSTEPKPINIRIIAATNRDLRELITIGLFREDLYYRLNGISVLVPPLRERSLDIQPLAELFLREATEAARTQAEFSPNALVWLRAQKWPGNVRQLKSTIERAVLLLDGKTVEEEHLAFDAGLLVARTERVGLRDEVRELERTRIEGALRAADGSQREAARLLGISRGALLRRLDQLGLRSSSKAD